MEPSRRKPAGRRTLPRMIYRVALHNCGHPQEAEDAAQDTLLKLCATTALLQTEEHLKSWRSG